MHRETITVPARDGFALAATRYHPDANPTHTVVLIHSATVVPRQYYRPFATFLAEEGYTAVSYDYRGIGGSRPASLRGFRAWARDWALLDMAGVIDWAVATFRPRLGLTHWGTLALFVRGPGCCGSRRCSGWSR